MRSYIASWAHDDPRGAVIPSHNNLDPSPNDLKPGKSTSGFFFESESLPGITPFFCLGYRKLYQQSELPKGFQEPNLFEKAYKGTTIGPVTVLDKTPISLIDRLISFFDDFPKLNWIIDPMITTTLTSRLISSKDAISNKDVSLAKRLLCSFITYLDTQKGRQIHENAWALLRGNAEYLIFCLSQERGYPTK